MDPVNREITTPSFICGAPKAGTTSLYRYLAQHPDVCASNPKETGFFYDGDRRGNHEKGIEWYMKEHFSHYGGEEVFIEASPEYMLHEKTPEMIAEHFEDARLIFLLRDPVERLYSHFRFEVNLGYRPPTEDLSQLIRDIGSEDRNFVVELGMYYDQLKRYERFFSEDQMLAVLFKDITDNTDDVVEECFEHLGVLAENAKLSTNKFYKKTSNIKHKNLYKLMYRLWEPLRDRLSEEALNQLFGVRSAIREIFFQSGHEKPELSPADRKYLADLYSDSNARLEEWLDRDLSHWT